MWSINWTSRNFYISVTSSTLILFQRWPTWQRCKRRYSRVLTLWSISSTSPSSWPSSCSYSHTPGHIRQPQRNCSRKFVRTLQRRLLEISRHLHQTSLPQHQWPPNCKTLSGFLFLWRSKKVELRRRNVFKTVESRKI